MIVNMIKIVKRIKLHLKNFARNMKKIYFTFHEHFV